MNLRNFQLNSDYPIDKIVLLREISVSNTSYFETSFNHGLGAVPYCKALLTKDNWLTSYPSGVQKANQQAIEEFFEVSSDATKVSFIGQLSGGGAGKIRVWGLFNEDTTKDVDVPPTHNLSANPFNLNSKFNYQRLFKQGEVNTSGGDVVINHGLGFVPIVDVWAYYNGAWTDTLYQEMFAAANGYQIQSVVVNDTSITFRRQNSQSRRFYYRMYANEA